MDKDSLLLQAYRISTVEMPIVTAPVEREWMRSPYLAAERCLPIVMANQSGWLLLSAHSFKVNWTGGYQTKSLEVGYIEGDPPYPADSTFGGGIVTFRPPYLFRTEPGYNLLVRGPANYLRPGVMHIEGLVETDWTCSTFTVNWQLAGPGEIYVRAGDPIAMLVPQRRSELEAFDTRIADISSNPDLEREYLAYRDGRAQWKSDQEVPDSYAQQRGWQRHYYQGRTVLGQKAPEHQTRRHLNAFTSDPNAG